MTIFETFASKIEFLEKLGAKKYNLQMTDFHYRPYCWRHNNGKAEDTSFLTIDYRRKDVWFTLDFYWNEDQEIKLLIHVRIVTDVIFNRSEYHNFDLFHQWDKTETFEENLIKIMGKVNNTIIGLKK